MSSLSLVNGRRPGAPDPARVPSIALPKSPIELTLDALEGPFRPLILWTLFWGARPFSELMRHVPEISKKTLRQELAEMERLGLVGREVRLGSNRKAEYSLTPLGQTLKPLLGAMYEWGLGRMRARRVGRRAAFGAGV